MAFTKTQSLDSVLLRQLNFRTPANAPISSLYTLYATGNGQTYWSNSVTPQHISSLSTSIGNQNSSIQSSFNAVYTGFLSTSSVLQDGLISTTGQLILQDEQLSNSLNNLNNQFIVLSNTLNIRVNTIYNSTVAFVTSSLTSTTSALTYATISTTEALTEITYSTSGGLYEFVSTVSTSLGIEISSLNSTFTYINNSTVEYANEITAAAIYFINSSIIGISSISTFYTELSIVQSSINNGLSTVYSSLSSFIELQNTSTYNVLTSNYEYYTTSSLISTTIYINNAIMEASYSYLLISTFSTFSSIITEQLLSTSAGITSNVSTIGYSTLAQISTIFFSTVRPLESTTSSIQYQISSLQGFSTSISSVTNTWISTFVSTSQGIQNSTFFGTASFFSTNSGNAVSTVSKYISDIIAFSTFATPQIQLQASTYSALNSTIVDLQYQFSVITTSSILAGIYETFMQLEGYTSTLIGSTIASTDAFKSSLYYSTFIENNSTAYGFFDYFTSTLYASTLSTLIPSTIAFTSSMVSSLYSTSIVELGQALNSTTVSITSNFYSTTTGLTTSIIFSTNVQGQSSILGYISSPGGQVISSISSLGFITLSTFTGQGSSMLITQSTIFGSTYGVNQTLFNNLYISSLDLYSSLSTQLSTNAVLTGRQLSSFSTQFGQQMSTQSGLYTSTLLTYPSTLNSFATSTNTGITSNSIVIASTTLSNIQAQTLAYYGAFTSSLNTATAGVSSLYTSQTINLTGSNYTGTMDLVSNRNFDINVYNLASNVSNIYRLTYDATTLGFSDYRQGIITINVSTVSNAYSNYNGKLRFDAYTWGLPNTIWGSIYPQICNSDYMIQYSYTIMNRTLYTTLNNVYPRIEIRAPTVAPIVCNVYDGTSNIWRSDMFWRGTPFNLRWSNYSFFPFLSLGAPPFNPEIVIEVLQSNTLLAEYGPYDFSVSSATIVTPYLTNTSNIVNPITARIQIVGHPNRMISTIFTSMVPHFTSAYMSNASNASKALLGGTELVMITDSRNYPLYNKPDNWQSLQSTISSFNNDGNYVSRSLVNGILNFAGSTSFVSTSITYGNCNVVGQFTENSAASGFIDFYLNIGNDYLFAASTIRQFNSQLNFTITNSVGGLSFIANNITPLGGSLYRVFNTSIPRTSNVFTPAIPNNFISYTYSPVQFISSLGLYSESTFIGPNPLGLPNIDTRLEFSNIRPNSNSRDPVSTVLFYNTLPGIIPPSPNATPDSNFSTTGISITFEALSGANRYSSTFTVTSALRQVLNF